MPEAPFIILSGPVGQGKTSWLQEHLPDTACGILGPVRDNKRFFMQLPDRDTWPMEAATETDSVLEVGRFRFSEAAFVKAKRVLSVLATAELAQNLVVVDEVGLLELRQEGFYPELKALAKHYQGPQLWVVRQSCVEAVIDIFGLQQKAELQLYQWPDLGLLKSYFLRTFAKT